MTLLMDALFIYLVKSFKTQTWVYILGYGYRSRDKDDMLIQASLSHDQYNQSGSANGKIAPAMLLPMTAK